MPEFFLYQQLDTLSNWGTIKREVPDSVSQNLNPKYELRPYQVDAFARFFYCYNNKFPNKTYPLHFLFNMATGSGKTLIMAGLILYLYDQGYRNFLFFVNSNNIIEKTKANFLNPLSIKFLFSSNIQIGGQRVHIQSVENFESVNPVDINICFTTIQKLHSDMTTARENCLTMEDFRKYKVVLIADEAHHMNVTTKAQGDLFESWENTVEKIFIQNKENLMLEFTATHDYDTPAMVDKYRNKVIIRYDLSQFRNDRFSKDVVIVQSDFDLNERILQAIILSQYKQEVAAKNRINLKPVILFKAQRTIEQSRRIESEFHKLIEDLTVQNISRVRRSNIPIVIQAFHFFEENHISDEQLVERLKREFQPDFCLSVNDERDKEIHQILVNTLEDPHNHIRAIFAVQKLSEGWDVLNLFDIVRCYETRDSGKGKLGSNTLSEAQLIGRGARYFPFMVPENNDQFRRKFDGDLENELRVLEELHYHSINDSRYIAEIRQALIQQGMMDEHAVTHELTLKESFKQTPFYKYGVIWFNTRRPKEYTTIRSLADLGVKKRNYSHFISTGRGSVTVVFEGEDSILAPNEEKRRDVEVSCIEPNIIQSAISRNPFFNFSNLTRFFPHLSSVREFIESKDYLGGLEITFEGDLNGIVEGNSEKLKALSGLLNQVEIEIKGCVSDYEGTRDFHQDWVHDVFKDRLLKFDIHNPRGTLDGQFEQFVSDKDWFAFNTIFGTDEEKAFVRMLDRQMGKLNEKYNEIYLLRNEGHFAIYNFDDGREFQPDFVLFLRNNNNQLMIYQLFIEPKGRYLQEYDRWKETFLQEITREFSGKTLITENKEYRLIGVPFYNNEEENLFRKSLESVL